MNTAKLRNRVPSKKISRTSKVLDISEELDDYEVLHKLLAIIRSIQANATEAILCGFDGVNPPRTCGSTYGVPADEVEDASDTDHPLFMHFTATMVWIVLNPVLQFMTKNY